MKYILSIAVFFIIVDCNAQETIKNNFSIAISPIIDIQDKDNKAIIEALTDFLKTKNFSLKENENWVLEDFQKYIYPYIDIYGIEDSKYGKDFYRPTLLEIIPTEKPNQKTIKIAFIGYNKATQENQLKYIFNIVANVNANKVLFSRYLDLATEKWKTIKNRSLTYKISPIKTVNKDEINAQQLDIDKICKFFNCNPIPITYYSCRNPKELFEIKGFDYHPMMYVDTIGGLADFGNIIFSGNNSEMYTHEIMHIYTNNLFPKIDKFIDEGFATFVAGSGKHKYQWHRNKFAKFLNENLAYNLAEHTDPYERAIFEGETPIPYLTSALILERTMRIYGKEKLIDLLKSEEELWVALNTVGLTKENINNEIRLEIQRPLTTIW